MTFSMHGICTALVTPFTKEDTFDETVFRELIDFQIASGIAGILVAGGAGEYMNITPSERRRVVEVSVDHAAGRVPVLVGALSPETRQVQEVARHARKAGADAVLVLPPYYSRTTYAGILDHFARVADAAEIPVVAYNNPKRTGVDLDIAALEKIAALPSVVALKECERDLAVIAAKIHALGQRLDILSGDDDLGFPTFMLGSPGGIFMSSNIIPAVHVELFDAVKRNDIARARAIYYRSLTVIETLYVANHPAPLKDAMALINHPVGPARAPLQQTPADVLERVAAALAVVGGHAGSR